MSDRKEGFSMLLNNIIWSISVQTPLFRPVAKSGNHEEGKLPGQFRNHKCNRKRKCSKRNGVHSANSKYACSISGGEFFIRSFVKRKKNILCSFRMRSFPGVCRRPWNTKPMLETMVDPTYNHARNSFHVGYRRSMMIGGQWCAIWVITSAQDCCLHN